MTHRITINDLLRAPDTPFPPDTREADPSSAWPERLPFLDTRTPAEFQHGHLPGAVNLPLFTNEERVQIGTTYKQQGREAAILLGFELTGAKWAGFLRQAVEIAPRKKVLVHCWRGGMRSAAMAWALDLYGFDVTLLEGGYKSYRRWTHRQFAAPARLCVIGGMTGSGKTRILQQLRTIGQQIIDLEDLAQHQGSAYGTLNRLVQPTQEQFENNLADHLSRLDYSRTIWVEDESISIGRCLIPKPFWNRMQAAPIVELQVPADRRVEALVREYGSLDRTFLIECTERITRRLGTEPAKYAIAAIREGDMHEFIRRVLVYYDKAYQKVLNTRNPGNSITVPLHEDDLALNARQLLNIYHTTG